MDIQPDIIGTRQHFEPGPGRADSTASRVRDQWEWALVDVGVVLLFVVVPHWVGNGADGAYRYQALTELLEHRPLTPMMYSLIGPLFSAPLYYLGKVAYDSAWWCSLYNAILLAGGLAAI